MLWPVPEGHDYHLPTARPRPRPPTRLTSASRRRLYGTDMWARPTADELTGRFRETGPDFYRWVGWGRIGGGVEGWEVCWFDAYCPLVRFLS